MERAQLAAAFGVLAFSLKPLAFGLWPLGSPFVIAKTKTASPSAMCLPPYIVFCAVNVNVAAAESLTSALITNARLIATKISSSVRAHWRGASDARNAN